MAKKNYVTAYCPNCGSVQSIVAKMVMLDSFKTTVTLDKDGQCNIEWGEADVTGDFVYVCRNCDTEITDSIEELSELAIKANNKPKGKRS